MRPRLIGAMSALLLVLPGCDGTSLPPPDTIEITVLVAYTPGVVAAVGDVHSYVQRGFDDTNLVYTNSGIGARLVPAHLVLVDYEVEDRFETLAHLLRPDDGVLDELHDLRDEHEADIVMLVSATPGSTINATVMAIPSNAFLIVEHTQLGAPGYGLAHEMGHLHGARHYSADDPLMEPFPYAHAFRNDTLHTVLTWGTPKKVPFFSGPNAVYQGVVLGDAELHDNARIIRETAAYLSNFRGPQTPTDFVSPGTWPVLPDL